MRLPIFLLLHLGRATRDLTVQKETVVMISALVLAFRNDSKA